MEPVALHRRREVETRRRNVARLDAVHARIDAEQPVGVAVALAAPGRAARREEMRVVRKTLVDRQRQRGHVARRRALPPVRQARSVAEGGVPHPQRARPRCHQLRERGFAAREILGDGRRHVVRRFHRHQAHGVAERDLLARAQADFRRRARRRMPRDRQFRIQRHHPVIERLEHEIQRHHLRQRRRIVQRIGVLPMQHGAGTGIDDKRRIAGVSRALRRARRCGGDERGAHCAPETAGTRPRRLRPSTMDHSPLSPLSEAISIGNEPLLIIFLRCRPGRPCGAGPGAPVLRRRKIAAAQNRALTMPFAEPNLRHVALHQWRRG